MGDSSMAAGSERRWPIWSCGIALALGLVIFVAIHIDTPAPYVEWKIPEHPVARAAYDYAHSIKLPDSVPKPVPFKFCRYNVLGLCFGKATRDEYFEHLCRTEAGEYVFRRVEGVEGIAIMSPRPGPPTETAYRDPVTDENPLANLTDSAFANLAVTHLGDVYVRPPGAAYKFLEVSLKVRDSYAFRRYSMSSDPSEPSLIKDPYSKEGEPKLVLKALEKVSTRYQIWLRGTRRERDREFGIAGAEILVLDGKTNQVIAVRRDFARGVYDYNTSSPVRWDTALSCMRVHEFTTKRFIVSVISAK